MLSVVVAAAPSPALSTRTDRVNGAPAAGTLSLTVGAATAKSSSDTVTGTDDEQLLVMSDSPVTGSTHAP